MPVEPLMLSNHLILCQCLLLLPSVFPSIRVFPNKSPLHIRWPKYWSFSFNIRWIFRLIGWISLLSKGLSRVFSNTTIWKHQFFSAQPSLWSNCHICAWLLEKGLFYLWLIILFLSSHPTCSGILPNMHAQLFAVMESTAEAWGICPHLLWSGAPSLLDSQEALLSLCERDIFLDLRSSHLIPLVLQSSASPPALSLACTGENKASVSPPLTKTSFWPRSASISCLTSVSFLAEAESIMLANSVYATLVDFALSQS